MNGPAVRGTDAARARRRVFLVALTLVVLSAVGFVLALVFQWPSQFTLDENADAEVTLGDAVEGTVTSIPLIPYAVLIVGALLARSPRWWGALATLVLTLLGCVFVIGGLGEIATENADVPRAVLVVAGIVYVVLGAALAVSGLLALIARWRTRRRGTQRP